MESETVGDPDITVPMGSKTDTNQITSLIRGWLENIMYGRVQDEWATVIPDQN